MRSDVTASIATVGVDQAAQLLGCNPNTLYRWAREGRIPCIRLGRSVRFRVAALEEWMAQQERQAITNSPKREDEADADAL